MDSHGYNMIGEFKVDSVATLPSFVATDERRIVYTEDTDKFYIGLSTAWQEIEVSSHASKHEIGGDDELDGDRLYISQWPQINYTPDGTPAEAGDLQHLTAHFKGIDTALNTKATSAHAGTHEIGGSDEIDGDQLDIDFTPTYYSPTVVSPATDVNDLTAHLKGIDTLIGNSGSSTHASTHITDDDKIGGDKLNIDYTPDNYTPTISPNEATDLDDLTAHLAGIDAAIIASGESIDAWIQFGDDGSTITVNDSYNVSSVTRTTTGVYKITFTQDFSSINYCIVGGTNGRFISTNYLTDLRTTTYCYITNYTSAGVLGPSTAISIMATGD